MILHGDSLEVLKTLDENSVDAIVTDPPYGLSFMGKKWDYDVPSTELWIEVLRVLKPGGHLLSFGGTRTYHRMVVAIEDAGFEIRDQIQWLYGSGFPKSMNVSKLIDKAAGIALEKGEAFNVVGGTDASNGGSKFRSDHPDYQPFEPASATAKQWQGWGTALKPANEPIVLARKPLSEKTVAKNVLKWGTGALNIDSSRIGPRNAEDNAWENEAGLSSLNAVDAEKTQRQEIPGIKVSTVQKIVGRTLNERANRGQIGTSTVEDTLCSNGQSLAAQDTSQIEFHNLSIGISGSESLGQSPQALNSITGTASRQTIESPTLNSPLGECTLENIAHKAISSDPTRPGPKSQPPVGRWPSNLLLDESAAESLGEPSRFFYVAKASKRERNAGLEGMPEVHYGGGATLRQPKEGSIAKYGYEEAVKRLNENAKNQNHHPTVKPIKLMEYLCRLITPPCGTILDPFCGSGSTGVAAVRLGFKFIGIEREKEYVEIAERRIANVPGDVASVS